MSTSKLTIDRYLEKVAAFADSRYGRMVRSRFKDHRGSAELAMLASPTAEELEQLKLAVAIMTPDEKETADILTDDQIQKIAQDARTEPALLAIFINGYALHQKRSP